MYRIAVLLALAGVLPLRAADELPAAVVPYVDGLTVAVIRADLTKLDPDAVFKQVIAIIGDEKAAKEPKAMVTMILADLKKAGVSTAYGIVSMANINDSPVALVIPLANEAEARTALVEIKKIPVAAMFTFETVGGIVIGGQKETLAKLKAVKPAARPDLATALAGGKEAAVHVAFAPTADLRRVAEETMPNLPKDVGGDSILIFSRGLTWATLTATTMPKVEVAFTAQATDATTAKKWEKVLKTFVENAVKDLHRTNEDAAMVKALAGMATPTVEQDRLVIRIDDEKFKTVIPEVSRKARESAARSQSVNNLKQIALATHSYIDTNKGRFPTDILDKDGKPLLSWRVHLLPYLEQENLYKQFKLDEPWDSEHNKKLIAKIPATFVPPAQKSAVGTTTYLGPLGDTYLFRPKAKEGLKITDIADGTSNTIMIVEAADTAAVEWTKPGDWTPDAKEPLKALLGHYPQGFNTAFCDGSVRFIGKSVDLKSLLAMLTTSGGEVTEIP